MSNREIINSTETLAAGQVGDYISTTFVESLTVDQADALEAAGIDIAETEDGRLVLVDCA